MALGVRGLALAALHELPPLDDVFVALSAHQEGEEGRFTAAMPFVQVGTGQLLAVARAACDAGANRLVLIAPTSVWQQMGGMHAGCPAKPNWRWPDCAGLADRAAAVVAHASRARGLVQRVAAICNLQMLPRSWISCPAKAGPSRAAGDASGRRRSPDSGRGQAAGFAGAHAAVRARPQGSR
jgi:hypothetical protein